MTKPSALPDRFRDVEHIEEVMTTPSAALVDALENLPGDIIVLGVGGKIGPSLAQLAKRAAPGKRVVGVARFSEKGLRERLNLSILARCWMDRRSSNLTPRESRLRPARRIFLRTCLPHC